MTADIRQADAPPLNYNNLTDAKSRLEDSVIPFRTVIRNRREELGLSQGDVARYVGIGSPEFIGMVEKGVRRLELNKVPRLADILQLNREDLTRLALFDVAPMMALSLFGTKANEFKARESKYKVGDKRSVQMTPEAIEYHQKLFTLPSPQRLLVLQLIDEFHKMQMPSPDRGTKASRINTDEQ